jgi:hypothetical protein
LFLFPFLLFPAFDGYHLQTWQERLCNQFTLFNGYWRIFHLDKGSRSLRFKTRLH